ncbi:glycosyltransferase [Candidatus Woesearchaeota archaeon]|nr:glycosyltransferase [Candidatus Woesearchaeota archaeon]
MDKRKKFSLIIPVAPDRNIEILNSIKNLDYPKPEFHVIVVRGRNPSENRNRGALRALGEIIVFLDDDGVLERDYLKKAEEFFDKNKEIDIVGGPQLTPKDEKGFAKISGYALSSKFGAWKVSKRYYCSQEKHGVDETCLTSANLLCRRKVIERIKFEPKLFPGEDPKFISDARKQGFNIAYSPDIIIYHRRRNTTGSLIKQIFNYGKVRPEKEKFLETLKMPFFLVPSFFAVYLMLLIFSIIFRPSIAIAAIKLDKIALEFLWIVPFIAYLVLIFLFSLYDSLSNKDFKAIFILPFIYPMIHLSYGIGMIYGYIKKLR